MSGTLEGRAMPGRREIPFSPPDITQEEIDEVVDTLKSGWITTGPKTKELERRLAEFTGAARVACLASATAALECALRALGIGPGDEVITSAYTYTASCSPICHVGAMPVLADVAPDSFEMDYASLDALITPHTRAIIPVDIAGRPCDYDVLESVLDAARDRFEPANERQAAIGRIAIVADGAHALGATCRGKRAGEIADLTTFSFHAVKNFTTAEGGALAWRAGLFDDDALYREIMLMALHGQTKDALAKTRAGAWEYDIAFPGWKCNMTDIQAALGLAQLRRYPGMLARRRALVARYEDGLAGMPVTTMRHYEDVQGGDIAHVDDDVASRSDARSLSSSGHLMLVRMPGKSQAFRNALIERLAEDGVMTNVHYKPLPLLTAYRGLGFDITNFPNALAQFENEITLPLHTKLSDEDVDYVVACFRKAWAQLEAKGVR